MPFRQEESFVRRYLAIEQERLQERLVVEYAVDEACRDALVPHLILQPIAENAVRHGVAPYARPGRVWVTARCAGDTLELIVEDDGPGLPAPGEVRRDEGGAGIGLTTTRERLERLYGDAASLRLEPRFEGGLRVTLRMPFCTDILDAVPQEEDGEVVEDHA